MRVNPRVHQIKIVFNITPQIERFVHIYLIEGKKCYLIDTGVDGSEELIAGYMTTIGRDIREIRAVLLTHSHPDHIGAASEIKRISGCDVYACAGEQEWIENIDQQFAERPIPNFYGLLKKPVAIDNVVKDGDLIDFETGLTFRVYETSGHSQESLSYYLLQDRILFTGDAIPIAGDIPIYISKNRSRDTLEKLYEMHNVDIFCSAWDQVRNQVDGKAAIKAGLEYLNKIDETVQTVKSEFRRSKDNEAIFVEVCERLNLNMLLINPLFRTSLLSHIENT
jgi:hydroxyacylglutathione hydrolase